MLGWKIEAKIRSFSSGLLPLPPLSRGIVTNDPALPLSFIFFNHLMEDHPLLSY
jgi:hypothetical protein